MGYRNLRQCVEDLERSGRLRRIGVELDADQDIGIVQRRVYAAGGPALLFTRVRGCRFPMLGNLFGTLERTRFIFRDALEQVRLLVDIKRDPRALLERPGNLLRAPLAAAHLLPRFGRRGAILAQRTSLAKLPQLKSWPLDGGAFITLPLVYTEDPDRPGWRRGNLGMYRVQISGGRYAPEREAGLHYQIHRGIGAHHAEALARGEALRVNVFVGGPPSLSVAAVMPLPEGMPELAFAGLLGGHRLPLVRSEHGLPMPAEADFVISGTVDPHRTLPEGPFGDHLGYYSLAHEFPVLQVDRVYHREDAIWPFTTVGRPPQEDTSFGAFIHELSGPLIPEVLPGVHAVHAVDAAGVHPLLLAVGSERYVPYAQVRRPMELLTLAHAILGQGQLSLAKYLFIIAKEDAPQLDIHDIPAFFRHVLERVDWRRDLHFHARTTIDTLDYSGHGLNEGSKLVVAVAGPLQRQLPDSLPSDLHLPPGFSQPRLVLPGVLAVQGPSHRGERGREAADMAPFCAFFDEAAPLNRFPLVLVVDDSEFVARTLDNFLWTVFTRSNPAADVHGVGAFTEAKHWGCTGSLVIDARRKDHHPPALEEDPAAVRRVEELAARGGPLHGLF
ncbi:UbiD family decarboxylase [Geoalkalibacter sp.]|uniref:UbiD family decarboxylase n=1 Tax=Geoalkalibacter sp. TaxID=3041440 RepID=UPI00272E166B|nr:UbiD family decarboxylase [Geoalkalibacter sp.]